MSRYDAPDHWDVMVGMRFSPVDPLHITKVLAAWRNSKSDNSYRMGFIASMRAGHPAGNYVYITLEVDGPRHYESVSTQYFEKYPNHLLERSENWFIDGDVIAEINENLGYSQAHAKHGTLTSAHRTPATA